MMPPDTPKADDENVIYIKDNHSIETCSFSDFPMNGTNVLNEVEIIRRIAFRKSSSTFAYITNSNVLKSFNLTDKKILGEYSFHNITVSNILISENEGNIYCGYDTQMYIFTSSCYLIKEVNITKSITTWVLCPLYSNLDYIAFVDKDNLVCITEAFFPEKISTISTIKGKIKHISFNKNNQTVYIPPWKKKLRTFLDSPPVQITMTIFTVYILFADDIKVICTKKTADPPFSKQKKSFSNIYSNSSTL